MTFVEQNHFSCIPCKAYLLIKNRVDTCGLGKKVKKPKAIPGQGILTARYQHEVNVR